MADQGEKLWMDVCRFCLEGPGENEDRLAAYETAGKVVYFFTNTWYAAMKL